MNELRTKWIAALRSDEYQQTTEQLRNGKAYCCLGVLCDISGMGEWQGIHYFGKTGSMSAALPSPEILSAANTSSDQANELAERNDGERGYYKHTFTEIADLLESWFPEEQYP